MPTCCTCDRPLANEYAPCAPCEARYEATRRARIVTGDVFLTPAHGITWTVQSTTWNSVTLRDTAGTTFELGKPELAALLRSGKVIRSNR